MCYTKTIGGEKHWCDEVKSNVLLRQTNLLTDLRSETKRVPDAKKNIEE